MVDLEVTDADRRRVAELRHSEPWFPAAFAAFERIWSGDATEADWQAIEPFMHGRWDADVRARLDREASQRNAEAAGIYYSAGAVDPQATRAGLAHLRAPVLLVAGEYDVALPLAAQPRTLPCFRRLSWPCCRPADTSPGTTIRRGSDRP